MLGKGRLKAGIAVHLASGPTARALKHCCAMAACSGHLVELEVARVLQRHLLHVPAQAHLHRQVAQRHRLLVLLQAHLKRSLLKKHQIYLLYSRSKATIPNTLNKQRGKRHTPGHLVAHKNTRMNLKCHEHLVIKIQFA